MAISRKDPKGRKLREGENWRNDGRYSYRYTDVRTGKRLHLNVLTDRLEKIQLIMI